MAKKSDNRSYPENQVLLTGTLSFHAVFSREENPNSGAMEYSVNLLVPAGDTKNLKTANDIVKFAAKESKLPSGHNSPIMDGNLKAGQKGYEGYENTYRVRATSREYAPSVYDKDMTHVKLPEQIDLYAGCKVLILVSPWTYNSSANSGVGLNIISIRKLGDGPKLSSGGSSVDQDAVSNKMASVAVDEDEEY
jgi:hypothetical protein